MTFIQKVKIFLKIGDTSKPDLDDEPIAADKRLTEYLSEEQKREKSLEENQYENIHPTYLVNEKSLDKKETYICKICGKKFDTNDDLQLHYRTQPEVHEAYGDEWDFPVWGDTKEKQMFRKQQYNTLKKLNELFPQTQECCICGKKDFPPFLGRDGNYYCRDHILPENRITNPNEITDKHNLK